MVKRKIGIGIIGMGWMGTVHSRAYTMVPDRFADCSVVPNLVICADDVEARADEAQRRFGFTRSTTDWRRVIDDPDIEVINIATPNYLHLELAKAAAAAGKHIFCEKPVGLSPAETAQIEQVAREAGVFTFVGFNYRWAPAVQRCLELAREGKLGDPTHYRGWLLVGYVSNPNSVLSWRMQADLAGLGALGDMMSHAIDMAMMLSGPIKRVVAQKETFIKDRPLATPGQGDHYSANPDGPRAAVTNEDYVSVLVQFHSGARGTLETCRVIQGPQYEIGFSMHGTQGAIRWECERMNEFELFRAHEQEDRGFKRVLAGPECPLHANFAPGAGIGLGFEDLKTIEAYHFMQSIGQGKQAEPGFLQALAVAEVQDAIQRSWETQRWEEVHKLS